MYNERYCNRHFVRRRVEKQKINMFQITILMTPCNFADIFICISDWLKLKFTGVDFFILDSQKFPYLHKRSCSKLINITRDERPLHTSQLMKNLFKPLDRFPSDTVWLRKIDKHLYDYCMFGISNKVLFLYGSTVYPQQNYSYICDSLKDCYFKHLCNYDTLWLFWAQQLFSLVLTNIP